MSGEATAALKSEHAKINKQNEDMIYALKAEVQKNKASIGRLDKALRASQDSKAAAVLELQRELQEKDAKIEELRQEMLSIGDAGDLVDVLQQHIASKNETIEFLEQGLKNQEADAKRRHDSLAFQVHQLKSELQEAKEEREAARHSKTCAEKEKQEAMRNVEENAKLLKTYKHMCKSREESISDLQEKVHLMQGSIEKLTGDLEDAVLAATDTEELRTKLDVLMPELESARARILEHARASEEVRALAERQQNAIQDLRRRFKSSIRQWFHDQEQVPPWRPASSSGKASPVSASHVSVDATPAPLHAEDVSAVAETMMQMLSSILDAQNEWRVAAQDEMSSLRSKLKFLDAQLNSEKQCKWNEIVTQVLAALVEHSSMPVHHNGLPIAGQQFSPVVASSVERYQLGLASPSGSNASITDLEEQVAVLHTRLARLTKISHQQLLAEILQHDTARASKVGSLEEQLERLRADKPVVHHYFWNEDCAGEFRAFVAGHRHCEWTWRRIVARRDGFLFLFEHVDDEGAPSDEGPQPCDYNAALEVIDLRAAVVSTVPEEILPLEDDEDYKSWLASDPPCAVFLMSTEDREEGSSTFRVYLFLVERASGSALLVALRYSELLAFSKKVSKLIGMTDAPPFPPKPGLMGGLRENPSFLAERENALKAFITHCAATKEISMSVEWGKLLTLRGSKGEGSCVDLETAQGYHYHLLYRTVEDARTWGGIFDVYSETVIRKQLPPSSPRGGRVGDAAGRTHLRSPSPR